VGQAQAARLVIAAIAATLFLDGYQIAKKRPSSDQAFRSLWSLGVMYVILSFLADVAPEVAGAFSVLLIVVAIGAGEQTINEITSLIGGHTSGYPPGILGPLPATGSTKPPPAPSAPPGVHGPVG
jgi:hypothetical protein